MTRRMVVLGGTRDGQVLDVPDGAPVVMALPDRRPTLAWLTDPAWEPEVYAVAECASPGGEALMMPLGERRWRVLVPASVPLDQRDALLRLDERPVVDGGHRPVQRGGVERGVCIRCGQAMLRDNGDGDCWHPHDVLVACPPERDLGGFSGPSWGFSGRPGPECFRPIL